MSGKRKSGTATLYGKSAYVKRARKYETARPASGKALQAAVKRAILKVGELKGVDTDLTQASVLDTTSTNAGAVVLNLIQTGNGSWNRNGREAILRSVRLRGQFNWAYTNEAVTGNIFGNVVRMVVVWDKQPSSGTIPTFDTIFGQTSQLGTETTEYLDAIKYDNMKRFQVLRDIVHEFKPKLDAAGGTVNAVTESCPFDEYIDLKNRESVYSGQSNPLTIADISTGALYVYFRAAANVAATSVVSVSPNSFARLRYSDPQ